MSVIEVNKDNFEEEVMNSDKPVVVDFHASWCGPCQMMGPVFKELSGEYDDVTFAKISTETEAELATKFGVRSIPTLVFVKNGEETSRLSGFMPKARLKSEIDKRL